jgi:hypothetical protein
MVHLFVCFDIFGLSEKPWALNNYVAHVGSYAYDIFRTGVGTCFFKSTNMDCD